MSECLFTLGPQGKRVLEQLDGETVQLERRLPKYLEHFLGINEYVVLANDNTCTPPPGCCTDVANR